MTMLKWGLNYECEHVNMQLFYVACLINYVTCQHKSCIIMMIWIYIHLVACEDDIDL